MFGEEECGEEQSREESRITNDRGQSERQSRKLSQESKGS